MQRTLTSALLLTVVCMLMPACAQPKVPEDLAGSLRSAQSDLNGARDAVVRTTQSLKDLRDNRGSNVQPQYQAFADALSALEAKVGGAQVSKEITDDKAQVFFSRWEQQINQIQDQDVAQSARERQQDVINSFQNLKNKIALLRTAYRDYYASCVDVRNTMSNDQTSTGAEIARPAINAAITKSPAVLDRISQVNKTVDEMVGP
ncbi:MAG: hypothetical protein ACTHN5_16325 [Phycisphaerae bacterium]